MRKRNKSSANSPRLGLRLAALLAIGLLLAGLYWCFSRLHDLWIESAQLTNVAEQITLTGNDYVPSDAILSTCGLTNGANLARLSGASRKSALASSRASPICATSPSCDISPTASM